MSIKYDYRTRQLPKPLLSFTNLEEELLIEQGNEGWELCAVNTEEKVIKYFFKRVQQHIVLLNKDDIADWASDHLPKDGQ